MSRVVIFQSATIIVVLIIAAISAKFLFYSKEEVKEVQKEDKLISLKVQSAQYSLKHFDLEYTGRVLSSKEVVIAAQVSGELKKGTVNFKKGESFRKGEVLLRINDDQQQAILMSSRSSFLTSLSKLLPDLEIDFPNEYSKWDKFLNNIRLTELMPKLPEINSEKERVFLASNNILTSYYNIKQQEITLSRHIIRAPFHGAIYSVNAEVGAIANPASPLATIIRTDALEVEVPIKPEDRKDLNIGQPCHIIRGKNQLHKGKVVRISPFLDRQTQMASVFVSIQSKHDFLEGEYLQVNFPTDLEQKVITLPREAVGQNNKIFLVKDEHLISQKAQIVQMLPDSVVVQGIPEGELMVMESLVNLKEGDHVNTLMGR